MPTREHQPAQGQAAVFSGPWLRYEPVPGVHRYHHGYVGTVTGFWNGAYEIAVDTDAVAALAETFHAMADYVGGDWRTVDFDGRFLTVARPLSLGGGVHRVTPDDGRYRIGWGLPWQPVDLRRCDQVFGRS
ncbi:hypothetical protein E1211_28865 [Micromonospora sp. 15K316]|nr:hypothetical protein E1211_28865 [Micromonospora sp. 15K316]